MKENSSMKWDKPQQIEQQRKLQLNPPTGHII